MLQRKLFGHPDSGHAFKVRLCLCVAGIAHDYEFVDISTPREQRSAEFRQWARFGEVPVLVEDGRDWMLGGETPTIADFSLFGYLVFADEAKVSVPQNVQAWLARLAALEGWQHPYQLLAAAQ